MNYSNRCALRTNQITLDKSFVSQSHRIMNINWLSFFVACGLNRNKYKTKTQSKQQQTTNNEQNAKIKFEKERRQKKTTEKNNSLIKNDPKCCSLRCYHEFHLFISYGIVFLKMYVSLSLVLVFIFADFLNIVKTAVKI